MAQATVRSLTGLLHDLTDEEVLTLTNSSHRPALKRFLAEQPARPTIVRRIKLRIDRSVSPADMLRAMGCDRIDPWMLERCPAWKGAVQVEEVEVCLIDMGREWLHDGAIAAIDELGLARAPDNAPLWTLSKDQPDLQRETWVVDPESIWQGEDGNPCVACVYDGSAGRNACLRRVTSEWGRRCRVLALSK